MIEFCETPFNVLGFLQNDGEWATVALELDLWGYGDTKEESIHELMETIAAQLSFVEYKEDPDLIFKNAPMEYFQIFTEVKARSLRAKVEHSAQETGYFAGGMPFPENIGNSSGFAVA